MLENAKGAIKNIQSRETGNIRYTRHRTNKRQRIPKGQLKIYNTEKLATWDTQVTRRRQTKQKHNIENRESIKN